MESKTPTLLIRATSVPSVRRMIADTVRDELKLVPTAWPKILHQSSWFKRFFSNHYENLGYLMDWQDAFMRIPELSVRLCNINNVLEMARCLKSIREYPLIVVLHSAAGDHMSALLRAIPRFQARRGKLVVFFGNEYNSMPAKINFAKQTQADIIASQLPIQTARWLYGECRHSAIVEAPAALNPNVYFPVSQTARTIDLGFRGHAYDVTIGDIERTRLLDRLKTEAGRWQIAEDIQYTMMPRTKWATYLNACAAIPGAESGTYYLEKDDRTQVAMKTYLRKHPAAIFEELFDLFLKNYSNPVSGKAISSRHFEPIGTETCQLLLEGHYNGILQAGIHYIGVKKDLSNVDEAIRQVKDRSFRETIARQAREHILSAHTYAHRVQHVLHAAGLAVSRDSFQ